MKINIPKRIIIYVYVDAIVILCVVVMCFADIAVVVAAVFPPCVVPHGISVAIQEPLFVIFK